MSGGNAYAEGKVKGPAIALLVAMGLSAFFQLIGLAMNLLGVGLGAAAVGNGGADNADAMANLMGGTIGIVTGLIGLAIGGFVIFGCLKMMKLESYGLVMGAVVVAMIPCISPCCLLGLPFGIWALVVLNDPQVKGAFR